MLIHEQFYTSAAELLDSTSSNLGVVAQTHGFPKELGGDLDAHRSYTLRSEDIRDAASCPPRFAIGVCGRQKDHLVISRVTFAGADHTGRTRPFAHHLAVRCDEIEREGVDLASFVAYATGALRDKWDGPPAWLDPRTWDAGEIVRPDQLSAVWSELLAADGIKNLLANVAEALVADPASRHPVVICIPSGHAHSVLEMCADVLSLLPATVQSGCVCVSHVVEMADYLRDSALVFTYPNTPFLSQSRHRQDARQPLIFDLSSGAPQAHPSGHYADAVLSVANGASLAPIRSLARLWDQCGMVPAQKSLFARVVGLRERLTATPAAGDVTMAASELAALPDTPALRARVDEWSKSFLKGLLSLPVPERWTATSELACDDRWPERIRAETFDVLARHAQSSLPIMLGDGSDRSFEISARELGRRAGGVPAVASTAIQLAVREPTERHLRFAAAAVDQAKPTLAIALQWQDEIGAAGENVQNGLQTALISQLARTCRSREDLAALRERTKLENPAAQFNRHIYREVLKRDFAASSSDRTRQQLADLLMNAALQEASPGASADELRWMLEIHRPAITARQVGSWLQRVRGTPQEAAFMRVAADAGLLAVAASRMHSPTSASEPTASRPAPPPDLFFGEGGMRSKPMKVGRVRGVLPPAVLHGLASLLLVAIAIPWVIANRWWTKHSLGFAIVASAGLASWLTSMLTDRAVRSRPDRLRIAFVVRNLMAIVLIVLIVLVILAWFYVA